MNAFNFAQPVCKLVFWLASPLDLLHLHCIHQMNYQHQQEVIFFFYQLQYEVPIVYSYVVV